MASLQEEQLKTLKRKVLDKKNKVEAMVFELREMNEKLDNLEFPVDKDYSTYFEELNDSILRLTSEIKKLTAFDKVKVLNIEQAKSEQVKIPEYPTEIETTNLDEIKFPEIKTEKIEVKIPEKFEISNLDEIKFPEIKTEKVEVNIPKSFKIDNLEDIKQPIIETKEVKFPNKFNIDWENAPKHKEKVIDIKNPLKTLQNAIETFLTPFLEKFTSVIDPILHYVKEPDKIIVTDKEITEWYGKKKVAYSIKDDGTRMKIIKE